MIRSHITFWILRNVLSGSIWTQRRQLYDEDMRFEVSQQWKCVLSQKMEVTHSSEMLVNHLQDCEVLGVVCVTQKTRVYKNEKLRNFYSLPCTVRVINPRMMRWMGQCELDSAGWGHGPLVGSCEYSNWILWFHIREYISFPAEQLSGSHMLLHGIRLKYIFLFWFL